MAKFIIRKVDGLKFTKEILALQKATLPEDKPLSAKNGIWWLAFDEQDKAVGFASLRDSYQWFDAAYFQRCGVLPQARGQGLQKGSCGQDLIIVSEKARSGQSPIALTGITAAPIIWRRVDLNFLFLASLGALQELTTTLGVVLEKKKPADLTEMKAVASYMRGER